MPGLPTCVCAPGAAKQEPPRLTGVKTFNQVQGGHNEVLQEYSFVFASKLEVKLLVKLLGKWQGRKGVRSMLSSVTRLKVLFARTCACCPVHQRVRAARHT